MQLNFPNMVYILMLLVIHLLTYFALTNILPTYVIILKEVPLTFQKRENTMIKLLKYQRYGKMERVPKISQLYGHIVQCGITLIVLVDFCKLFGFWKVSLNTYICVGHVDEALLIPELWSHKNLYRKVVNFW